MIRNSFIFLDRMGKNGEQGIWQQGIKSWDDFLNASAVKGISSKRKLFYELAIKEAKKQLCNFNSSYFTQKLPCSETWRLYDFFKEDALFLDIETTGFYGDITVIGMYDGYDTKMMVKGSNLDKNALTRAFDGKKLIVTFNGASFDLPVIEKFFGKILPPIPHLDLRFACKKIGLTGGLKAIEKTLNIKRCEEVSDMSGMDAVYLWQMYQSTGKSEYLELLIKYNEEDIVNLKPLAEHVVKELRKTIMQEMNNS